MNSQAGTSTVTLTPRTTQYSTTSVATSCVTFAPTHFVLQVASGSGTYSRRYAVLNMGTSSNNKRSAQLEKRIAVGLGVDMTGTISFETSFDAATVFTLSPDGIWTSPNGLPAYLDNPCASYPMYQIKMRTADKYNLESLSCSVVQDRTETLGRFTCSSMHGDIFFSLCQDADMDLRIFGV